MNRSLNVEDIFHNFPKACDISDSEVVPTELLADLPTFHFPLRHDSSKLDTAVKQRTMKEPSSDLNESSGQNIQKKPTPWTAMMKDRDLNQVT